MAEQSERVLRAKREDNWQLAAYLLDERLAPGGGGDDAAALDRAVGRPLHHQLPQVPLLPLHGADYHWPLANTD